MSDDRPSSLSDGPEPTLCPVGVARTPYESPDDAPHQGFADGAEAEIEVFEEYADQLAGVEEVIRVTVVYWAHLADRDRQVGDDGQGAFARRGPDRPNPLAICTCMVLGVEGRRLRVGGLDAVDGSPVVDLKPALQAER